MNREGSSESETGDQGNQDVRQFRRRYQQVGPDIAYGLMTELNDIPEDVFDVVPRLMTAVLTHAAQRGDIRLDGVTARIAALPGDLLRHELMLARGPASDAFLAEVVDDIFLPLVKMRDRPRPRGRR